MQEVKWKDNEPTENYGSWKLGRCTILSKLKYIIIIFIIIIIIIIR